MKAMAIQSVALGHSPSSGIAKQRRWRRHQSAKRGADVADQTPDDFASLGLANENVERLRVDTPEHGLVELGETAGATASACG